MLEICRNCPLYIKHGGLSQYVPPLLNPGARYALIGEAPGQNEVEQGAPFVGAAGQEQNQYLRRAQLSRDLFNIINIVQCRPPGNRDPKPEEIAQCSHFVFEFLDMYRPVVIGAIGRFAARFLLDETLSMEYYHGIPLRIGDGPIVVPIYHPAAGMKTTTLMTAIAHDYEELGRAIRQQVKPRPYPIPYSRINYADFAHFPAERPDVVAIDTETLPNGDPWCLTYCLDNEVYRGRIIYAGDEENCAKLQQLVENPHVTTVLHNALFDLKVLNKMGVHPANVVDTMVMAYLLQDLPLGLKPLAYRLVDLKLSEYKHVIYDAQQEASFGYLMTALGLQWPAPEPLLVWDKGYPKVKQPKNIGKKIQRLIDKYIADPDNVDLQDKWQKMDGIAQVEQVLGPMPQASLADVPKDAAEHYACMDAVATYKVYELLSVRIKEMGLADTLTRDMGIIPMLTDMMEAGILIDTDKLETLGDTLQAKRDAIDDKINALYQGSERLNPSSPQQVSKALYEAGVFPRPGMSTDAQTLDLYKSKSELIQAILDFRETNKLLTTYVKPLPLKTDHNGRVHTKLRNTATVTGRLASSDPNLQNIPTRTDEGKAIRGAFVATPGCSLVSWDYSQIEMRSVAHVSQDPTMIDMFIHDLDVHTETASRMFRIPLDQVDKKKHRYPAKRIGFGVVYGMGPHKLQLQMLAEDMHYTVDECEELISMWFGVYPKIYEYMDCVKAEARRTGIVRDCYGRLRRIPETMSVFPRIREAGLRQAGNFPIQSMAQQIIKQAMMDLVPIYKELQKDKNHVCRPLLQIHDELIWEVSNELLDEVVPLVKSVMVNAVELHVPVVVDHAVAHSWEELD